MANRIIAFLHPKNLLKIPIIKMLESAPILEIDPSHEICSLFNGPSISGVSFDNSFGRAGENHPTILPIQSVIKFAIRF